MRRTIHLETNHEPLLTLARSFYETHQHGRVAKPEFTWRIVCEPKTLDFDATAPLSAFSDPGLGYVNIGQRSFLAVDIEERKAIAFLSDQFVEGETRFKHRPPLDILFCMTAPNLGLTSLCGACVSVKQRAALIFGSPNSGKTTASYLATNMGLEFHSDQVVFLDTRRKVLRAWGDPFPAVFRPETLEFLPELRQGACRSTYATSVFYYVDKRPMQARWAQPVMPVCNVFLVRGKACKTQLTEIGPTDALPMLRQCALFREDAMFDEQVTTALTMLADKPTYRLQYDRDPKIAATTIEEILR